MTKSKRQRWHGRCNHTALRNTRSALFAAAALLMTHSLMADTNQPVAEQWLAHTEIAPPIKFATSKAGWEKQRSEIRKTAWDSLGKLPPRPKRPTVKTL